MAAGAGGVVGVAGVIGVTVIACETDALIEKDAQIDGQYQTLANPDQSVYVNAADNVGVKAAIIGIAGGVVGVSGAISVGVLDNNTVAKVESGATLKAKRTTRSMP